MTLDGRRARDRRRGGRPPLLGQLLFWRSGNRRIAARPSPSRSAEVSESGSVRRAAGPQKPSVLLFAVLRLFGALLVAALLAAGAYGVRYFLLHSPHFALRVLRISPTRHVTAETLRKRAALPAGVNLFQLDLQTIKTNLATLPWLRSVKLHRELPSTLHLEVTEYEPVALVGLDSLYLVSDSGEVFKRATPGEYAHLPVITGFGRAAYLLEPEPTRAEIRTALLALSRYQKNPRRPPVGEVHYDHFLGMTLYTEGGVAIRLGHGSDGELDTRLGRFDAVWLALARANQRPAMLFLDNRAHPDHVTVRLAPPPG